MNEFDITFAPIMKHKRIYRMLVNNGHSPVGALDVLVDARRGKDHAIRWIKLLFRCRR